MTDLILTRFCDSKTQGVFGRMTIDGQTIYTVERPWLDNQQRISCIPVGEYYLKERHFHKGNYAAIAIVNVPDRTHILFHKANKASELLGCIAPGMELGFLNDHWAVTSSGIAFDVLRMWFMGMSQERNIKLKIEWTSHE